MASANNLAFIREGGVRGKPTGKTKPRCFPSFAFPLAFQSWMRWRARARIHTEGKFHLQPVREGQTRRPRRDRLFIARNASGRPLASDRGQNPPVAARRVCIGASSSPKLSGVGSFLTGCWASSLQGRHLASMALMTSLARLPGPVQATTQGFWTGRGLCGRRVQWRAPRIISPIRHCR